MLKNMAERRAFIESYPSWGVYVSIPELEMVVYRKDLPDGSSIYACEYRTPQGSDGKSQWRTLRYQLVKKGGHFGPNWDSISTIMEHMMHIKQDNV